MNTRQISTNIIIASILLFFSACSEPEFPPEDCTSIATLRILSQEETDNACIYNKVFLYQSEIYITCVCCICGKIYMANKCDGTALCEFGENCMTDFDQNAKFLYNVGSL